VTTKINTNEWVEIRCNICDPTRHSPRLLLKITVENLTDDDKPTKKIGIESKCKDCKDLTYRTLIV